MKKIQELRDKKTRLCIGLMSGTSLDGIDAVMVRITGHGIRTEINEEKFKTYPYPSIVRQRLLEIAENNTSCIEEVCKMNFLLGNLFADAALKLINECGYTPADIDLIGSHGQTLWHAPVKENYLGFDISSTLQLGEGAVIAEKTKSLTISDFRVRDVAAGGQGAPLVPYTEYLLYGGKEHNVCLLNLGGIANITILEKDAPLSKLIAFDTGPANMLIDKAVSILTGGIHTYDKDGEMASAGKFSADLFSFICENDNYTFSPPPKTTGREKYSASYASKILNYAKWHAISDNDVIRTLSEYTAWTVAYSIEHYSPVKIDTLIVNGGGASNPAIMAALQEKCRGCTVMTGWQAGINPDAKEATAFAILANEALFESENNALGATGAEHQVVMGKLNFGC